jgi:prophage antirepressor-like protein
MERSDCTVKQRYYFERVWKRALFSYAKFRKEVQIMNEVQIFNNEEFGQVRIVEIEGKPYFVGKDVANALGYSNPRDAILRHCKGVVKHDNFKEGGQLIALITEGDMYRLITHSKLESAERFEDWVFDEVLPAIRKHGIYATDDVIDNILNNPDFGIQLLTKLKEERVARVEAERRNAILMHVNKTYTVTEIAKELGLKSAIQLNKILAEKKIQYQVNGTWVMYSKYSDLGYEEIKQEVLDSGRVIYHRRITQMGREFILQLFADKVA